MALVKFGSFMFDSNGKIILADVAQDPEGAFVVRVYFDGLPPMEEAYSKQNEANARYKQLAELLFGDEIQK